MYCVFWDCVYIFISISNCPCNVRRGSKSSLTEETIATRLKHSHNFANGTKIRMDASLYFSRVRRLGTMKRRVSELR